MSGIIKKWLYASLFLVTFLILLAGSAPLLVQEFILPPVLKRAGLDGYKLSISRLGLSGCSIHIAGRPSFSSPVVSGNLRIDWTPSGLLQRRIEKISSSNLLINLADSADRDKQIPSSEQPLQDGKSTGGVFLPVIVQQVEVRNGSLRAPSGKHIACLPFTFSGHLTENQNLADPTGTLYFQATLEAAGQQINLALSLPPSLDTLSLKMDANLDLATVVSAYPLPGSGVKELGGTAWLTMDTAARLAPFSLQSAEAVLLIDGLLASGEGFTISSPESQPARITASGTGSSFQVTGSGLRITEPLGMTLNFDADIGSEKNRLHWQGTIDLEPDAATARQGQLEFRNTQPVRISHNGSGTRRGLSIQLATTPPESGTADQPFVLQQNEIEAAIEKLEADVRFRYGQPFRMDTFAGTLSFQVRNATVTAPQGSIIVPDCTVQVDGSASPEGAGHTFAGRLKLNNASVKLEQQDIQMEGIQLELPANWPWRGNGKKGLLRIGTLRQGGRNAGNLDAEIIQNGAELHIDAALHTPLFPEDNISLSGSIRPPEANKTFADFTFTLDDGYAAAVNFAPFLPDLHAIKGTGKVTAHGSLSVTPCGLTGKANLSLNSGSMVLEEAETEIKDLSFSLSFPALPTLVTSPMQQFSIGEIQRQKLAVNDVRVLFGIEAPGTLFIERISGHWSGGRVFTSSFRLGRDQDALNLAIFCDRLELSSILSQLNLAEAGGEGRLSGRVPVTYSGDSFFVDDGFLFSTPGEKGYLKIKQSKYLETTIPANVPQFSPLHFAGAALADFEYNWAKLQIKSEEENLLVKLQVDGRPREKLPYRFDAGKNVFVRLEDESRGGIDQPIKLDVNFNIPVNELLQYKNKLMPLFRKFN